MEIRNLVICVFACNSDQKKTKKLQSFIFKVYEWNSERRLVCKAVLGFSCLTDFVPSHIQSCLRSTVRLWLRGGWRNCLKWVYWASFLISLVHLFSSEKETILSFPLYLVKMCCIGNFHISWNVKVRTHLLHNYNSNNCMTNTKELLMSPQWS